MVIDAILIIVGILLILFRQRFSKEIIDFQNSNFNYKYGEKEIKSAQTVVLIVGVGIIATTIMRIVQGT